MDVAEQFIFLCLHKMTQPIVLGERDEPTIVFTPSTVVKYQPQLYNGIRESVYYNTLHHPHIVASLATEFIDYVYVPTFEAYYASVAEWMSEAEARTSFARIIKNPQPRSGLKITFPRYVSVDAIAHTMTPAAVETLFRHVADALAYLEENEILQSDVKPGNIFYDKATDTYLLADFDMAFYTTECFINRVATPTTRPIELAYVESVGAFHGYKKRLPYKASLTTTKGDVFSLGVTVAELLLGEPWYSADAQVQASKTDYTARLEKVKALTFKYKDLLLQCLEYDYKERPTCVELARQLGTLRSYTRVQTIPRDDMALGSAVLAELKQYKQDAVNSGTIIRVTRTAALLTTFYSIKQLDPADPKIYYCYMVAGLILSALLCSGDSSTYMYEAWKIALFEYRGLAFLSEASGELTPHEQHYGKEHGTLTTPEALYASLNDEDTIVRAMLDICITLDWKLLF